LILLYHLHLKTQKYILALPLQRPISTCL
jgi:hypothetical protein